MRAALFIEPHRVEAGDRPDPVIAEPTDAVVRVVLACVCGSDLWPYRGESPFEPGRSATSSSASSRMPALTSRASSAATS
jgi:threonine dehydrogenase-like Zn-dependent dehydrogenase